MHPATWLPWVLLLSASSLAKADDTLGQRARCGVPMSCAALALISGADYPEAIRVYDEWHPPRTFDRSSAGNLTKFGPQRASLLTSWYLPLFSVEPCM